MNKIEQAVDRIENAVSFELLRFDSGSDMVAFLDQLEAAIERKRTYFSFKGGKKQ